MAILFCPIGLRGVVILFIGFFLLFFCSGSHLVQLSEAVLAILVQDHERNINHYRTVKLFESVN